MRGETIPHDAAVPAEGLGAEGKTPLGSRPIALIGFMGGGKSAVGRRLASQLGYEFVGYGPTWWRLLRGRRWRTFSRRSAKRIRGSETEALTMALAEHGGSYATGGARRRARATRICWQNMRPSCCWRLLRP